MLAAGAVLVLGAAPKYRGSLGYWFVGMTQDHMLFDFIDAPTITYDGAIRSAWVTEVATGTGIAKFGFRRKMTLTLFDCRRNAVFESRTITYDQRAAVLLDHSYDDDRFRPIVPGGVDATELKFVCARPDDWATGQDWTKVDGSPETMADNESRLFKVR